MSCTEAEYWGKADVTFEVVVETFTDVSCGSAMSVPWRECDNKSAL